MEWVRDIEWAWVTADLARVVAVLVGLVVLYLATRWFLGSVATRAIERGAARSSIDIAIVRRRNNTLRSTLNWVLTLFFMFIAIGFVLGELGFNIATLFAAVGVVGIAIGLGAQALVRDVINGLFILMEDQYGVGDVVEVAGIAGEVIEINPRRTVLRDLDGSVHSIPNGAITTATNMTRGFSRINIDFSVAYEEDIDHAIAVINAVCIALAEEEGDRIIQTPKVLRVNALGADGVDIKVLGDVLPSSQWELMGELRRRVKIAFDREGIEIPYPHRTLIHRGGDERNGRTDIGDAGRAP